MPIASTDIVYKGSNVDATAGNVTANAGPGTNLGDFATSGVLTSGAVNNVFPNVTGDENAASQVDYQLIFVHNAHATLTLQGAKAWIAASVAGGTEVAIGLDTTAPSPVGATVAQALTIANRTTAPTGVAFSAPGTKATALNIGDIPAGSVKGIWIRRTAANTAPVSNDGATIRVEGDTAA